MKRAVHRSIPALHKTYPLRLIHLWLEDVEETWLGERTPHDHAFVGESLERAFIIANAVTAVRDRLASLSRPALPPTRPCSAGRPKGE
mgnify:CR=1 FL=1